MTNRKKRKKLRDDIIRILKKADRPVATQNIAEELKKPWHSVHTRCLMLQIEGVVDGFRVGRMNLWQLKKEVKEGK